MEMILKRAGETYDEAQAREHAGEHLRHAVGWVNRVCPAPLRPFYCEHGTYVGFGAVFAASCQYCSGAPLPSLAFEGPPVSLTPAALTFPTPEYVAALKATDHYYGPR